MQQTKSTFNTALSLSLAIFLVACNISEGRQQELTLRYYSPAKVWEETLPLGNGRIGMMPDGGIHSELIVLNDITMWSGSKDPDAFNPDAIDYLPEIRKKLLEGKNLEAQELMYRYFRCGGEGSAHGNAKDSPYGSFQMVGCLHIDQHYRKDRRNVQDSLSHYERTLSLNNAIAATRFNWNNTAFAREYFASHAHDVLVIRLSANKKRSISFDTSFSRPERVTVRVEGRALIMEGQLNDGHNGDKGVRYITRLEIIHKGGKFTANENSLSITDADEAILLVSSSTNMLNEEYIATGEKLLSGVKSVTYEQLINDHKTAYKERFNRVQLYLGEQDIAAPTNERLIRFQSDDDPSFASLYFQFGRYLMISGSRENSLPMNLQGLWANQVQTPWNGDYHLNINLQMNYWPAEVCNLPELHKSLVDFTRSLVHSGGKTASTFYGAKGWVAHMMSNPWQFTAPGEHASWGATNTGGAWLCGHLWEHFAFSGDTKYLRSIYPVLTGAADFFLSSMIEEPKNGWLVTSPSSSPENAFYIPGSNVPAYVCMGPTMDVQLIGELFSNTLTAAEILGVEDEITFQIREALPKIPPMQISSGGCLQEWLEDYKEQDPRHRHVSHLYGLYPSNQISPVNTPELADAARETLERRGDGGTGWSRAWKVNFWARLHDGNRAYKLLKNLLIPAFGDGVDMSHGGGTYPNLFCAHPPFQIDGNLGGTAGIAEMLIQSHDGYIHLLPALPDNWDAGHFKGFRVRGGAVVDAIWEKKRVTSIRLLSTADRSFQLKVPDGATKIIRDGRPLPVQNGVVQLEMKTGDQAELQFAYLL